MDQSQRGRPLAIDHKAATTSPTEPAFIARPEGAPVYHGFVILDDIAIEGSCLARSPTGKRNLATQEMHLSSRRTGVGQASFGIVWEVCDPAYFEEIVPMEAARWGVWGVGFPLPMASRENARKNLESILPQLKSRWAEWNSQFSRNNR